MVFGCNGQIESVQCRLMLQGTLRVLLVLLHDFPEFLCEYHFQLCNAIPPSCIQMRNLILSAFPRNMRLPDPFTPNLKVDLLPEINQSPKFVPEPQNLLPAELRYACIPTACLDFMQHSLLGSDIGMPPAQRPSANV